MKIARFLITLLLLVGVIVSAPVALSVYAQAPKSTDSLTRLTNVKKKAMAAITKREKALKAIDENAKRYKGKMLQADYLEIEKLRATMKTMLGEWKDDINKATTVDEVKSKQKHHVMKTRFYMVFKPDYQLMTKAMVMSKAMAQVNKRTENIEKDLSTKKNNEKNNKYENAAKKLADVKVTARGSEQKLVTLKNAIFMLTPDLANKNRAEFNKKLAELRQQAAAEKTALNKAIKHQKELRAIIKTIKKTTLTP